MLRQWQDVDAGDPNADARSAEGIAWHVDPGKPVTAVEEVVVVRVVRGHASPSEATVYAPLACDGPAAETYARIVEQFEPLRARIATRNRIFVGPRR